MLTSEKSVNQSVGRRRFSETKVIAYVLRRDPLSMFGLAFITILVFTAIFAPIIAPYKSDVWGTPRPGYKFLPPSLTHLFGTDYFGRDVFSLVLMGARASLMAGLVVVTLSLLIGCPLGVIAGYFRGTMTDEIIMRITDMFLALPPLLLAIAVAATLGYSLTNAMIAVAISWWPWYTRLMRAQAASLRERPFVEAARGLGVNELTIMFRHILPNSLAPIIVQATMDIGSAILLTSALSFLGLGAQPPTPEWGLMVSLGRDYLINYWWYATFPGLAIFVTVMAFNLLGDGLRKALDPRLRIKRRLF
jgi:peptide/nickel transport system permease protein